MEKTRDYGLDHSTQILLDKEDMASFRTFDSYIGLPLVGIGIAALLTVWGWKMNGANANALLIFGWAVFMVSAFRLTYRESLIPAILWTMLLGGLIGLPIFYFLWTPKETSSKIPLTAASKTTASSSGSNSPVAVLTQSDIASSGKVATIQNSPNSYIDQSTHSVRDPMSGALDFSEKERKHPQYISLGGARFFSANPTGIILTDGKDPLLSVDDFGQHLLVSAWIRDKAGDLIAELRDNEWHLNQGLIFDRNYSDSALEVRERNGKIVLQVAKCGDVIHFEGFFRLKSGNVVSIGRDDDGRPVFGLGINNEVNIKPIFKYPSALHLGSAPGYEDLKRSEPPIVPGQPFGYLITQPIDLGVVRKSGK